MKKPKMIDHFWGISFYSHLEPEKNQENTDMKSLRSQNIRTGVNKQQQKATTRITNLFHKKFSLNLIVYFNCLLPVLANSLRFPYWIEFNFELTPVQILKLYTLINFTKENDTLKSWWFLNVHGPSWNRTHVLQIQSIVVKWSKAIDSRITLWGIPFSVSITSGWGSVSEESLSSSWFFY